MLPEWHEVIVDQYVEIENVFSPSSYIRDAWCEKHRSFHTLEHLEDILSKIKKSSIKGTEREILVLSAYFHDVIYDPLSKDNEEQCAQLVKKICTHSEKDRIAQIILDTKHHDDKQTKDNLSKIFMVYDTDILRCTDYQKLLKYEDQILYEYQIYDYNLYKIERSKFLKSASKQYENFMLSSLADYVENRILKIGLLCGSFNPFHLGHYSILHKAELIFDKVIICSGVNPEKINVANVNKETIDNILEDRKFSIKNVLPYHQIHTFSYSLPRLLEEFSEYQVSIVKGIRSSKDLEEENLQRAYIEDVVEDYSIVYIPADRKVEHISSSGLRFLENEGKTDKKSEKWANMYKCDIFEQHSIKKLLKN